ncbi:MAG: hypothetical protein J5529_09940 [Prevotella sp.]|nr:hypothetical protein [Prevotella sp.]
MKQLSKTFAIFANAEVRNPSLRPSAYAGGRHRGEQTGFYPSENLENSSERGKRLKAVPPVECIYRVPKNAAHIHTYRCELIFILSFTGIPEPSDEECHEGPHLLCCENNLKC